MTNLLIRQIRKYFGDASSMPPEWQAFVEAVDRAYSQADVDRGMLERSLELSSGELVDANAQMRVLFRHAQAELESQVEARTSELREANESLQREIVERQRAEVALGITEAKFRTLVEQMPAVTYLAAIGEGRSWRYVSPQIVPLLGYTPEEWTKHPGLPAARIHEEDRERVADEEMRCREEGVPFACEYRLVSKEGRVVWCRDQAILLKEGEEEGVLLQGVILDITERKVLEDQLRQSLKLEAIGRLAGGIAHDFNNILTAIIGYSSLVAEEVADNAEVAENVSGILASTERAASLTRQLLAYSRRQTLLPKAFDLNGLIINIKSMLGRLIGENVELRTEAEGEAAWVMADPGQIEQVLTNLVVNARDAMPEGGVVSIATNLEKIVQPGLEVAPGDYVKVIVKDTGVGMSKEALLHLFEPFFTTKSQGKGTGLGLAMCYGIIKQSGGLVTVRSEVGRGTSFEIFLPRVARRANIVAPAKTTNPELPRGSGRVLLAEDEMPVRTLTARLLRSLGYEVYTAADGAEAVVVFEGIPEHKIDLLLTDVIMPQMGGKELAQKLRTMQTDLKVLFISGYTRDVIGEGDITESNSFLQKPFTPTILASKVQECLLKTA